MNRGNGNPLLAGLIVLITLWVTVMAAGVGVQGICGWDDECGVGPAPTWVGYLAGGAAWFAGLLILLGGLWCAWRAGTGRWGLRRPAASSPSSPA